MNRKGKEGRHLCQGVRVCTCVYMCVGAACPSTSAYRPQCQESAEKLSVCVCWGMCVWHNNAVWDELIAAPFVAPHCESMRTARLSQEILAWVIQEASLVLLLESLHEAYVKKKKKFDGEQVHCPCVLCPRACVYLCVCVCGCVDGHQYPPLCLRLLSAIGQWKPLCNLKCPKNKWRLLTSAPPPSLSVTLHLLSCCDFTVWVTGWTVLCTVALQQEGLGFNSWVEAPLFDFCMFSTYFCLTPPPLNVYNMYTRQGWHPVIALDQHQRRHQQRICSNLIPERRMVAAHCSSAEDRSNAKNKFICALLCMCDQYSISF